MKCGFEKGDASVSSAEEIMRLLNTVEGVRLGQSRGGLVIDVATRAAAATIAIQGAQVLSFAPRGHDDLLWCSPVSPLGGGKAIRGGIPICWPWFGPHADTAQGQVRPQHGFARNLNWDLIDAAELDDDGGHIVLTFRLPQRAKERELFTVGANATLFIDIGRTLSLRLETDNEGDEPFTIREALHTYFSVGAASAIEIDGLSGSTYRDNTDSGRAKTQTGAMSIRSETIALFDKSPDVLSIADPVLKRRIEIVRDAGSQSTIVWNPGASAAGMIEIPKGDETRFVCVESGNIGACAISLAPGDSHSCGVSYRLAPL